MVLYSILSFLVGFGRADAAFAAERTEDMLSHRSASSIFSSREEDVRGGPKGKLRTEGMRSMRKAFCGLPEEATEREPAGAAPPAVVELLSMMESVTVDAMVGAVLAASEPSESLELLKRAPRSCGTCFWSTCACLCCSVAPAEVLIRELCHIFLLDFIFDSRAERAKLLKLVQSCLAANMRRGRDAGAGGEAGSRAGMLLSRRGPSKSVLSFLVGFRK